MQTTVTHLTQADDPALTGTDQQPVAAGILRRALQPLLDGLRQARTPRELQSGATKQAGLWSPELAPDQAARTAAVFLDVEGIGASAVYRVEISGPSVFASALADECRARGAMLEARLIGGAR